ncbi:MAG: prepilin-type N-terminal cleavage/methylation domain-containing protein [Pseudomonadota bacterium]
MMLYRLTYKTNKLQATGYKLAKGFTLIELLVAVAILASISTLLYSSLSQTLKIKDEITTEDNKNHSIQLLFSKLTDELNSTFIKENETNSKIVFIGSNEGDTDSLIFDSFSHYRFIKNSKESDQSELQYKVEQDSEKGNSSFYNLIRREGTVIDDDPESGGMEYVLAENIKKFNIRYCDGLRSIWRDDWDSRKADFLNRLPMAVEFSVTLADPKSDYEEEYKTIITIELEFMKKIRNNIKMKGCVEE